jgi:hypothetical protein
LDPTAEGALRNRESIRQDSERTSIGERVHDGSSLEEKRWWIGLAPSGDHATSGNLTAFALLMPELAVDLRAQAISSTTIEATALEKFNELVQGAASHADLLLQRDVISTIQVASDRGSTPATERSVHFTTRLSLACSGNACCHNCESTAAACTCSCARRC